ncbi:MAG: hypothetical protein AB7Y46_05195 [Armatimonadota bacterium]
MSVVNGGLGERLTATVTAIQAREAAAEDDTAGGRATKRLLCRQVLLLAEFLDRGDGTNALDYDDQQRTAAENYYKSATVGLVSFLLGRLRAWPVRSWPEVDELAQILADLQTTEDTSWRREVVELGGELGITIERKQTIGGAVAFETAGGTVSADVCKARDPAVALNGVDVYLLEMVASADAHEPSGRYAIMVDDPWWGRRIQPAAFCAAPLTEQVTMGYRLKGRILQDGQPVNGANVSLELTLDSVEDGSLLCWDSLEFNELIYDSQLETWVQGAQVRAPIMTDAQGRWEYLAPRGHGALYQRPGDLRDDSAATAARGLARCLRTVCCAYLGRKLPVMEGEEAVLDILSGRLEISGEAGVMVRVGTFEDPGQEQAIPPGGTLTLTGLPQAEHSIVAYRLTGWGTWDQSYGCPRVVAQVRRGETTFVTLPPMEQYTQPDVICGRVYERMGVPAAGIEIVVIDTVSYEIVGTLASTDEEGYWEAQVPPEGLGGQPAIHDAQWGSVPVLGVPYSDVVLGARVYAAAQEQHKPECWRRPLRGHKNFQYCPGSVVVRETDSGQTWGTQETQYGGWVTTATLPKFRYVEDIEELVLGGPQAHRYEILVDGVAKVSDFELRGQPFDDSGSAAGAYRAAGYYPEQKLLLGGKIRGNVLVGQAERVGANLPEAARVGLEFGRHVPFVEARALGGQVRAGMADLVCPYCGGPARRDPGGAPPRGFCLQCAAAFGRADAMDCRGYFETPTLAVGGPYALRLVRICERDGGWSRRVRYHWRPDLYDETDDFLTQSGAGQPTNAPRWVAKHVNELGDGLGFGRFDGDLQSPFIPGHRVEHFAALPEIDRELGLTALKLVFPAGHVAPISYTVEIDCIREDEGIETRTVTIPAGTAGPSQDDEFGDAVPVAQGAKLVAESVGGPYHEVGLYVGVADVRLIEPASAPGCEFTIVNDAPWLASPEGVAVQSERATPVAVQVIGAWGDPHLLDDAVGQLFLFWAEDGDIWMRRRAGLPGPWTEARRVTDEGDAQEPWAGKDERGQLVVVCSRAGGRLQVLRSPDDGRSWEEVG